MWPSARTRTPPLERSTGADRLDRAIVPQTTTCSRLSGPWAPGPGSRHDDRTRPRVRYPACTKPRSAEDPRCLQPALRAPGTRARPDRQPDTSLQRRARRRGRCNSRRDRRPKDPDARPGVRCARRRGRLTSRSRGRDDQNPGVLTHSQERNAKRARSACSRCGEKGEAIPG